MDLFAFRGLVSLGSPDVLSNAQWDHEPTKRRDLHSTRPAILPLPKGEGEKDVLLPVASKPAPTDRPFMESVVIGDGTLFFKAGARPRFLAP